MLGASARVRVMFARPPPPPPPAKKVRQKRALPPKALGTALGKVRKPPAGGGRRRRHSRKQTRSDVASWQFFSPAESALLREAAPGTIITYAEPLTVDNLVAECTYRVLSRPEIVAAAGGREDQLVMVDQVRSGVTDPATALEGFRTVMVLVNVYCWVTAGPAVRLGRGLVDAAVFSAYTRAVYTRVTSRRCAGPRAH